MPFVVDASVAACWAFDDEDHPAASVALERLRTDQASVPAPWWFEVCNVLVTNERRGRIAPEETRRFLQALSRLPIAIDREPIHAAMVDTARTHGLSAYDAAYLELATREDCPLATLDNRLAAAARAAGVAVL